MNIFNRLLVILASLIALVASAAVLLVTLGVFSPTDLAPSPWFVDRLEPFTQVDGTTQAWTVGICAAVIVASIVLLVAELRPPAREPRRLLVRQDDRGQVTVSRDSVRDIVNWEAGHTDGVMEADSRLGEDAAGLRILCRVALDPEASAPEVAETLQRRIKQSVEHHIGRAVSEVSVATQLSPLDERRRLR